MPSIIKLLDFSVHRVLNGTLSEAQEALAESADTNDISSILTMCNTLKRFVLFISTLN
jgi:hypothetical protein